MRKAFNDIERRLLVNKPVIWISSIYWILALCVFIIVVETVIGLRAKFATDLTVFYASAILLLVVLLFLWISFQYRNYDKIFSIRQTFKIYVYNILAYIFICISSLVLVLIMTFRFNATIFISERVWIRTSQEFSRDLLSVRIAHLSPADIRFIRDNPQLFTSIGSTSNTNAATNLDLKSEYVPRKRLDENPFIKSNISYKFNALVALRKMPGFEYLDSVMKKTEESYARRVYVSDYGIDEDPVFYKYLESLSDSELDSLREHSETVITDYGLTPYRPKVQTITDYYRTLILQVSSIALNSEIPTDQILMTVIILMSLCSITFNFILTKNTLCLFAPFVYLTLVSLFIALVEYSISPFPFDPNREFISIAIGNLLLSVLLIITIQWRKKKFGRNLMFFIHQLHNLSALGFFIILFVFAGNAQMSSGLRIVLIIVSIAGFLITHYYFIRRMHKTLIQEV
ncbi:MAG TPA: hypothetical protein VKA49_17400 [Flavitalea sp.]|nr:hypothetical protein [Flavitalea sp.]